MVNFLFVLEGRKGLIRLQFQLGAISMAMKPFLIKSGYFAILKRCNYEWRNHLLGPGGRIRGEKRIRKKEIYASENVIKRKGKLREINGKR